MHHKENFCQLLTSGDWSGILKSPDHETTSRWGHVLNPRVFKVTIDRNSELPEDWKLYTGKTQEDFMLDIELAVFEIDQNGHALHREFPIIIPKDLDPKEIEKRLQETIDHLNQYPLEEEQGPGWITNDEEEEFEEEYLELIKSGGKFPRTLEFSVID
jgi:hypothetical protein